MSGHVSIIEDIEAEQREVAFIQEKLREWSRIDAPRVSVATAQFLFDLERDIDRKLSGDESSAHILIHLRNMASSRKTGLDPSEEMEARRLLFDSLSDARDLTRLARAKQDPVGIRARGEAHCLSYVRHGLLELASNDVLRTNAHTIRLAQKLEAEIALGWLGDDDHAVLASLDRLVASGNSGDWGSAKSRCFTTLLTALLTKGRAQAVRP